MVKMSSRTSNKAWQRAVGALLAAMLCVWALPAQAIAAMPDGADETSATAEETAVIDVSSSEAEDPVADATGSEYTDPLDEAGAEDGIDAEDETGSDADLEGLDLFAMTFAAVADVIDLSPKGVTDTATAITKVAIVGAFQAPYIGDTVASASDFTVTINDGACTGFTTDISWMHWNAAGADSDWVRMSDDEVFKADEDYCVYAYINLPAGYYYPKDDYGEFDGAIEADNMFANAVNPSQNGLMVTSKSLSAIERPANTINSLNVPNLDTPVCFADPIMHIGWSVDPSGSIADFGGDWYIADSEDGAFEKIVGFKFQPGKWYRCEVKFYAKSGMVFKDDLVPEFDGWEIDECTLSSDGTVLAATLVAQQPAPVDVTKVTVSGTGIPRPHEKASSMSSRITLDPADAFKSGSVAIYRYVGKGVPSADAYKMADDIVGSADWKTVAPDDEFVKNDYYVFVATATVKDGYAFPAGDDKGGYDAYDGEFNMGSMNAFGPIVMSTGETGNALNTVSCVTVPIPCVAQLIVITDGDGQTWTKGSETGLVFKTNGYFGTHVAVLVDGKELTKDQCTVTSGSTVVELQTAYLESLAVGKHTIQIKNDDGDVEGTFTIAEKKADPDPAPMPDQPDSDQSADDTAADTGTSPKTGDAADPMGIALVGALALCVAAALGIRRRPVAAAIAKTPTRRYIKK